MASPATAPDLLRGYVARQLAELEAALPRLDETEPVHQSRVRLRRLRSVLASYSPVVPDTGWPRLRRELQWLGSEIGPVRDLDVLAASLAGHPELVGYLAERRAGEYDAARAAADGGRARRLLDRLTALAEPDAWTAAPQVAATKAAEDAIARETSRVLDRADAADEVADDPHEHDERLHDVRKAAKRLRYTAEAAAEVVDSAAETAERAERVQEVLGARNDAVLTIAWLDETAAREPALAAACAEAAEGRRAQLGTDLAAYQEALAALRGQTGHTAAP
ncbi:CHAD domain-containing protein [Nocardioides speluncae]|uniref:CHAD domain-containing protein n=1 Tax=Nocardioides speluncae TaxID=2670337 RepID=UPI000D686D6C|nr:CHAD domain-containing protein [Nocardioides speluncae]